MSETILAKKASATAQRHDMKEVIPLVKIFGKGCYTVYCSL